VIFRHNYQALRTWLISGCASGTRVRNSPGVAYGKSSGWMGYALTPGELKNIGTIREPKSNWRILLAMNDALGYSVRKKPLFKRKAHQLDNA
jgi:hypothetical protein